MREGNSANGTYSMMSRKRTENVKRCTWLPSYKCLESLRVLVGEVVVEVDLPVDEGGEGNPGGEETAQHQEGAHCSGDRT